MTEMSQQKKVLPRSLLSTWRCTLP